MTPVGRRRATLALLLCGGVLGGLLIFEIGLRLTLGERLILLAQGADADYLAFLRVADDSIEKRAGQRFTAKEGTFSYDEHGFRTGSGLPYDYTVLFIGDSFTEGFGVGDEDTFARATERALRRAGIKARTLNAGHRGFGAAQELKVLRRNLARLPIDTVVVQSFPMNDYSDNIASGGFGVVDGQLVEYDPLQPPLRARLSAMVAQSWLRDVYVLRLASNAMLRGDPAAPFDSPNGFDLERALLREIVAAAGKRPVIVLVVPTRVVQEAQRGTPPPGSQQQEIERFEQVCGAVRDLGVPWIDAGAVITDLAADAAKGDGGHFSRDGNALIGEAVAQKLAPLLRPDVTRPGDSPP